MQKLEALDIEYSDGHSAWIADMSSLRSLIVDFDMSKDALNDRLPQLSNLRQVLLPSFHRRRCFALLSMKTCPDLFLCNDDGDMHFAAEGLTRLRRPQTSSTNENSHRKGEWSTILPEAKCRLSGVQ